MIGRFPGLPFLPLQQKSNQAGKTVQARIIASAGTGRWLMEVSGKSVKAHSEIPLKPGMVIRGILFEKNGVLFFKKTSPSKNPLLNRTLLSPASGKPFPQRIIRLLMMNGSELTAEKAGEVQKLLQREAGRSLLSQLTALQLKGKYPGSIEEWLDAVEGQKEQFLQDSHERRSSSEEETPGRDAPSSGGGESSSRDQGNRESGDDSEEDEVLLVQDTDTQPGWESLSLFNRLPNRGGLHWTMIPLEYHRKNQQNRAVLRLGRNLNLPGSGGGQLERGILETGNCVFRFAFSQGRITDIYCETSPQDIPLAGLQETLARYGISLCREPLSEGREVDYEA